MATATSNSILGMIRKFNGVTVEKMVKIGYFKTFVTCFHFP